MKKKIIAALFMVCMLISAAQAADVTTEIANGHAWIYTQNGTFGIPDAVFGASGYGNQTIVFFASSRDSATVTLSQTQGECTLLSYSKLQDGFTDTALGWGKYHVECVHIGTLSSTTYEWDNMYFNATFTLTLKEPGDYYIVVTPYTDSEMTESYLLDQFCGWTTPPYWQVVTCRNCNVYVTPSAVMTPIITAPPTATPVLPTADLPTCTPTVSYGSTCTTAPTNNPFYPPYFPIINEICHIHDNDNNVRSGPGTQYPILGQVNTGASFFIYDYQMGSTGKDWYRISLNGQLGWISSSLVELNGNYSGTINGMPIAPNPPATATATPEPIIWGFTNQQLSTRSGPGTNYTETGTYNELSNAWVQIRSRAWDNRSNTWWVEVNVGGSWLWTGYEHFDSTILPLNVIPVNPYY